METWESCLPFITHSDSMYTVCRLKQQSCRLGEKNEQSKSANENTRNYTGWCVEAHDLAASKLVAFRDKDRDFVRTILVEKLIEPSKLYRRLDQLSNNPRVKPELLAVMKAWVGGVLKDIAKRDQSGATKPN